MLDAPSPMDGPQLPHRAELADPDLDRKDLADGPRQPARADTSRGKAIEVAPIAQQLDQATDAAPADSQRTLDQEATSMTSIDPTEPTKRRQIGDAVNRARAAAQAVAPEGLTDQWDRDMINELGRIGSSEARATIAEQVSVLPSDAGLYGSAAEMVSVARSLSTIEARTPAADIGSTIADARAALDAIAPEDKRSAWNTAAVNAFGGLVGSEDERGATIALVADLARAGVTVADPARLLRIAQAVVRDDRTAALENPAVDTDPADSTGSATSEAAPLQLSDVLRAAEAAAPDQALAIRTALTNAAGSSGFAGDAESQQELLAVAASTIPLLADGTFISAGEWAGVARGIAMADRVAPANSLEPRDVLDAAEAVVPEQALAVRTALTNALGQAGIAGNDAARQGLLAAAASTTPLLADGTIATPEQWTAVAGRLVAGYDGVLALEAAAIEAAPVAEAEVVPEPTVTPETEVATEAAATPEATVAPEAEVTPEATVAPEAEVTPAGPAGPAETANPVPPTVAPPAAQLVIPNLPPRDPGFAVGMSDAATRAGLVADFQARLTTTGEFLAAARSATGDHRAAFAAGLADTTSNLRTALVLGEWEQYLDPGNASLLSAVAPQLAEARTLAVQLGAPEQVDLTVNSGIAEARLGNHQRAVDAFGQLTGAHWKSVAPADRAAALHLYARSLDQTGDRELARKVIDESIAQYEQLGEAGALGRAYAEVQRYALLDAPSITDDARANAALATMERTTLSSTITPEHAAALTRDLRQARTSVQAVHEQSFGPTLA